MIFANSDSKIVEDDNTGIPKYPLLFASEPIFQTWLQIQEIWGLGLLPNAFGVISSFVSAVDEDSANENEDNDERTRKERIKQKRYQSRVLKQNDLMPLCFMWDANIEKMAKLVMAKRVSVKSTKSTKKIPILPRLDKACQIEKKHILIKNEFMHYFYKKPLRCKTLKEPSYSQEEYERAAVEYQVSEVTIEMWYEKVIKDPTGEHFFLKRISALAPSNKADDFPTILRMLFEHQKAIKEKRALEDPTLLSSSASLSRLYKACWMNMTAGDLAKIAKLGTPEMVNWTKKDARVVIVYCFVNRKEKGKLDFSIMEQVLRTLHAMEYKDDNQFRRVRYLGVFITDRAGMVEVANAILERGSAITQSLPWLHTPTLYIT